MSSKWKGKLLKHWSWPQITNHSHSVLIKGGSGSEKTYPLFNLVNHQADIDKIYLYAKDPYKVK